MSASIVAILLLTLGSKMTCMWINMLYCYYVRKSMENKDCWIDTGDRRVYKANMKNVKGD